MSPMQISRTWPSLAAAGTRGFCKVWCAACKSMHAACALRCPVACMAPTSAGAAKSSRWTTAATATTWELRCQRVLLPQDAGWAKQGGLPANLHQALCPTASGAAHLHAGVPADPAHSAASSQLHPQLHGFLQSVQLSLIWIVLQQLLLQFLLQVLQSVLESVQPVLHPLQILRLHARAASLRL